MSDEPAAKGSVPGLHAGRPLVQRLQARLRADPGSN